MLHRDLNAETAFTALALFSVLRVPFEAFTDSKSRTSSSNFHKTLNCGHLSVAVNVLQAHISLARISEFLEEEDTQKFTIVRPPGSASDPVLGFTKASFTWSNEVDAIADTALFRVHDLNLNFPVGQLSIIVGPGTSTPIRRYRETDAGCDCLVGSGKTTLLMSLLGETNKLSGEVFLPSPVVRSSSDEDPSILTDTTAYCAQPPWLLSDTIQANILFGSRMNEARYQTVLDVCALLPDLEQFDLGDATEVGERGVVLSSGQKVRFVMFAVFSLLTPSCDRLGLAWLELFIPLRNTFWQMTSFLLSTLIRAFAFLVLGYFPNLSCSLSGHNTSSRTASAAVSCATEPAFW